MAPRGLTITWKAGGVFVIVSPNCTIPYKPVNLPGAHEI
jgi:hypothetical protein